MICPRCSREREPDEFPLLSHNPHSACVECLRGLGLLDRIAMVVNTAKEGNAIMQMERLAAEGRRVADELEAVRRPAIRELMILRSMSEPEATAWTEAWLAASKPMSVEPWVYVALGRGVRYDAVTQSIVGPV